MKPLIRWAGSKARFVQLITAHMPSHIHSYAEHFVGSGAVMLHLMSTGRFAPNAEVWINDLPWIRSLWCSLFHCPRLLVESYDNLRQDQNRDETFELAKRDVLNQDGSLWDSEVAAALLYLNKSSFSGIFRMNRKGEFNVPRDTSKLQLPDLRDRIFQIHELLQGYDLQVGPEIPDRAQVHYFDPPYQGKTFTSYGSEPFGDFAHRALADHCFDLVSSGAYVVVSNSDTPLVRELYEGLELHTFNRPNNVSSKASTRKESRGELIIVGAP